MTMTKPLVDVSTVRELVTPVQPSLSVYFGLQPLPPGVTNDTTEDVGLRWRALRTDLLAAGAPVNTVDAVGSHLTALPIWPTQYVVFAGDGQLKLATALPGGPAEDRARYGAPADVTGVLSWLQRHPAHVKVLIDRTGADVTACRAGEVTGSTHTVTGPDDVIERNQPGGWSQARYQRRAEDSWLHNARAAGQSVLQALNDLRARLLLVAGDVHSISLLREFLTEHGPADLDIRMLPGGRTVNGSQKLRQQSITEALADHGTVNSARLVQDLLEGWHPQGGVVEGATATLAALNEGRIDTLVIADDPYDAREAWFGPDVLCLSEPSQNESGSWVTVGRLTDVAIRAALLTNATVQMLSPAVAGQFADRIAGRTRYQRVVEGMGAVGKQPEVGGLGGR